MLDSNFSDYVISKEDVSRSSWDLWVYRKAFDRENKENQLAPLGSVDEVKALVESSVSVEWKSPCRAVFLGKDFVIEFDVGGMESHPGDVLDSISVSIRGHGNALSILEALSREHKLTLFDLSSGEELEYFSPKCDEWLSVKTVIDHTVEKLRYRSGLRSSRHNTSLAMYSHFWFNPKQERLNFIALEDNRLLVGNTSITAMDELLSQYDERKRIYIPVNFLKFGGRQWAMSDVNKIIDYLGITKCDVFFTETTAPISLIFSSIEEKEDFIRRALVNLPAPRRVFKSEVFMDGVYILTALFLAVIVFYWPSTIVLSAALIASVLLTIPLALYLIKGPKTYEIYGFCD